jgi:hypothetical protein
MQCDFLREVPTYKHLAWRQIGDVRIHEFLKSVRDRRECLNKEFLNWYEGRRACNPYFNSSCPKCDAQTCSNDQECVRYTDLLSSREDTDVNMITCDFSPAEVDRISF